MWRTRKENKSSAPGQTAPAHYWLLDVWSTAGRTRWHRSFAGSSVTTTNKALCFWYSYFLYLFKGRWNSWERRCIKQHNKLPPVLQIITVLEASNLFPALIYGGRQGLSLCSTHCTRQQIKCCILLFCVFLIQQVKPILSNSDFSSMKFI